MLLVCKSMPQSGPTIFVAFVNMTVGDQLGILTSKLNVELHAYHKGGGGVGGGPKKSKIKPRPPFERECTELSPTKTPDPVARLYYRNR